MMKGPVIIIIVRKVVLLKVWKVIIILGKLRIEISSDDARIYSTQIFFILDDVQSSAIG
jgi:hypothetical protein